MEPEGITNFEDEVTISALNRPKNDTVARVMADVPKPNQNLLSISDVYGNNGIPDPVLLMKHFQQEGRLEKALCMKLLSDAKALLTKEPNLLTVEAPVTVVGDLHGQFYDLVRLLELAGSPATTNYLFLGDYIDRGTFSVETTLTLFAYKLKYPNMVHLLRGNHECRQMAEFFNFRLEVLHKQDAEVYELFQASFDALPLAAIIDNRFFGVHGGISPELKHTAQIQKLNRFREPPDSGLMNDLLWSDPAVRDGPGVGFKPNSARGCGHTYGFAAVARFLEANHLLCIVRAHEAQNDGFKMHRTHPSTKFPTVITVFSAPNYCFADDHELLTEDGFIGLEDAKALFGPDGMPRTETRFAGYDAETDTIVWEAPGRLVVNGATEGPQRMVEFGRPVEGAGVGVGVADHDGANSNHVNIVATPDHDMRALKVNISGGVSSSGPWTKTDCPEGDATTTTTHKAADLADFVDETHGVRFTSGSSGTGPEDDEYAAALGLETEGQRVAFLQLYGFWLGDGYLETSTSNMKMVISLVKDNDITFILDQLTALGMEEGIDYNVYRQESDAVSVQMQVRITNSRMISFFTAYAGLNAEAMCDSKGHRTKPLLPFALTLTPPHVWALLTGLWMANGNSASARNPTETIVIHSSDQAMCEQVTRLAVIGGLSTHTISTYEAGDLRSVRNGKEVRATTRGYDVTVSRNTKAIHPVLHTDDVRTVDYTGQTWCTAMPHGHVVVRRVMRDAAGAITRASAPTVQGNCGAYGNKGALLYIGPKTINVRQFSFSDQPYVLPNFQNIFDWSLPFVIENVTELLLTMTSRLADEDVDSSSDEDEPHEDPAARRKRVLTKIQAVSRMARFARILREERETIIQLKGIAGTQKLPVGLLQGGKAAIADTLSSFQKALEVDQINEMAPRARRDAKKDMIKQVVGSVLAEREEQRRAEMEGRDLVAGVAGDNVVDTAEDVARRTEHRARFESGEEMAPLVSVSDL